ncbi:hypothetical protein V2154_10445 [Ewingella sp. CoE-038-23]|uniref:hypothetical protein n=1 Tax=Ewingella docleensis TaxID=3118588 RepID=UPI003365A231
MLLADIKLIEVNTLDVIFKHAITEPGQGKIRVEYGEIEFEAGGILTVDASSATIRIKAAPAVYGFRDGQENDDFSLKIGISMLYVYPSNQSLDETYLQENHWYFASMLKTYFKFYAEDIFNKSSIDGVKLPYN